MTASKIDYMVDTTRAMVRTIQSQGYEKLVFSAVLYKQGKKMNSIDLADASSFSKLIRNYVKTEQPDKIRVELKTQSDDVQRWMKQFDLVDIVDAMPKNANLGYMGLGEAEINDMVVKRFEELERQKEIERVNQEIIELRERNSELEKEVDDLNQSVEAKKHVEYYSTIIGAALPGLAKFFSTSAIGPALTFLSGTGESEEQVELETPVVSSEQPQTSVDLLCEFIRGLNEQEIATLYLLMVEVEKDRSTISKVLHFITKED